MTQTTYYEFNKPEGTDLVNPLVDINPNWDALDADLHEFNERSISNASEVVSLGVHTISRLDTTAKFLKWIATANYTAGETFTVDGLPVAATTPAGATLATNAYVTGSVVLACLNSDNTAMTVYVSGTTVATDSERLGGELPSYYGTASDVSDNATDITNIKNQVGNTSIVGIGDGSCTGAISAINGDLNENSKKFKFGYQNGKYGYYKQEGGADTFSPFSEGIMGAAFGNYLGSGIFDSFCINIDGTTHNYTNQPSSDIFPDSDIVSSSLAGSGVYTHTFKKDGYYMANGNGTVTYYTAGQSVSNYVNWVVYVGNTYFS